MNAFGNISQQEAEQAVRIWSDRQVGGQGPTINDLAESLRITTSEAEALVAQVRSQPTRKPPPEKAVWYGLAAAVVLAGVIGLGMMYASVRSVDAAPVIISTPDFPAASAIAPPMGSPVTPAELPPLAESTEGFNAQQLNSQAWAVVDNPSASAKDLVLAEQIAERASEMAGGQDPNILDTLARAYWRNGKLKEAVATQKDAISKLATDANSSAREQFVNRLGDYERALEGGGKKR